MSPIFPPTTKLLDKADFQSRGFVRGIEILNDQTTPMEIVVTCLVAHLSFTQEKAIATMLEIHNNGGILIAIANEDDALRIAEAITRDARNSGHNLICRYASV
jgi:ATP-dependent Clp protease adapter protein ClpS